MPRFFVIFKYSALAFPLTRKRQSALFDELGLLVQQILKNYHFKIHLQTLEQMRHKKLCKIDNELIFLKLHWHCSKFYQFDEQSGLNFSVAMCVESHHLFPDPLETFPFLVVKWSRALGSSPHHVSSYLLFVEKFQLKYNLNRRSEKKQKQKQAIKLDKTIIV